MKDKLIEIMINKLEAVYTRANGTVYPADGVDIIGFVSTANEMMVHINEYCKKYITIINQADGLMIPNLSGQKKLEVKNEP